EATRGALSVAAGCAGAAAPSAGTRPEAAARRHRLVVTVGGAAVPAVARPRGPVGVAALAAAVPAVAAAATAAAAGAGFAAVRNDTAAACVAVPPRDVE